MEEEQNRKPRPKGPPPRLTIGTALKTPPDEPLADEALPDKPARDEPVFVPDTLNWRNLTQVFAVTPEGDCPYLKGKKERKIVTPLSPGNGKAGLLNRSGFRRSHNLAYRPACRGCDLCKAVRVDCNGFTPTKSQRRLTKKAEKAGLTRHISRTAASQEHFTLFRDYISKRHGDGDMAQMGHAEFRAMIEETPVSGVLMEWREDGVLAAACLTDIMPDGLSMVYSYFDPRHRVSGLGSYMIVDLIALSRVKSLPFLYLGYWVKGSQKMEYKTSYKPLQVYRSGGWTPLNEA